MNELVDFYHVNIHPWIPILHLGKFRERMQLVEERPRITCILHAIIAVCIRFCRNEYLPDEETKSQLAEKSRQRVILDSTETFSVENLQALVIIAFETVRTEQYIYAFKALTFVTDWPGPWPFLLVYSW